MFKKLAVSGLGLIFLASPLLASADMLADLQAQIQSLFEQITTLKARMAAQVTAPTAPVQSRGCPALARNLIRGMRGDDILRLQAHLGVSQTGFFGPATEAAVQKLQMEVGIAAPNTGAPAGYGQVGPRTRAAIALRCGGSSQTFSASPISGSAPLTVSFSGAGNISGISYGDGTSCNDNVPDVTAEVAEALVCHDFRLGYLKNHTYTKPGVYKASATRSMPSGLVGEVTVTVSSTNQSPLISSFTGPTTLVVGQTSTWNAQVSDPDNDHMRYVVRWGDEPSPGDVAHPLNWPGLGFATEYFSTTFTHAYHQAGTYTVRLSVIDDFDINHVAEKTATVQVGTF